MKKILASLFAVFAVSSAIAGPALSPCSNTDVVSNSVACFSAPFAGNDANGTNGAFTIATQLRLALEFNDDTGNVFSLSPFFLPEPWELVDKSDGTGGTQAVLFTSDPSTKDGVLTFDQDLFGWYAVTLKAGPGYNAYLMNFSGENSLSYSIDKGLSHASLWTFPGGFNSGGSCALGNCDDITTPVPEPGTLALFGLGLAGLGAVARRRNV